MNTTRCRIAAAVAVLGLLAAACGDSDDTSTDTADTTAAGAAPAPTTGGTEAPPTTAGTSAAPGTTSGATDATAAAGGEVEVAVAESELGAILVDGEGRTLYGFLPDAQGDPTCVDECLDAWPALVGTATAGEGADDSLLGTATRPDDGSAQVTYNGWPLYYFAQDAAPGDVNGQGVGDIWYVMTADGEFADGAGGGGSTPSTTTP